MVVDVSTKFVRQQLNVSIWFDLFTIDFMNKNLLKEVSIESYFVQIVSEPNTKIKKNLGNKTRINPKKTNKITRCEERAKKKGRNKNSKIAKCQTQKVK